MLFVNIHQAAFPSVKNFPNGELEKLISTPSTINQHQRCLDPFSSSTWVKISPFPCLQMVQIETAQVSTISETKYQKVTKKKRMRLTQGWRQSSTQRPLEATTRPRLGVLDPDPSLRGETYRTWPIARISWLCYNKYWFMLSVRISSYRYTQEVWRAQEKRKSCSRGGREQL